MKSAGLSRLSPFPIFFRLPVSLSHSIGCRPFGICFQKPGADHSGPISFPQNPNRAFRFLCRLIASCALLNPATGKHCLIPFSFPRSPCTSKLSFNTSTQRNRLTGLRLIMVMNSIVDSTVDIVLFLAGVLRCVRLREVLHTSTIVSRHNHAIRKDFGKYFRWGG